MKQKHHVVVAGDFIAQHAGKLPERLTTPWQIDTWVKKDGRERIRALLATAEAMITGGFGREPLNAPKLRLLQIPFTGYDWLDPTLLPPGCVVCNAFEHEIPIAEYVMLAILEWQIGYARAAADFKAGSWRYLGPPDGPFHAEAYGKTVGLIGYGHIAREVARRAGAFGMRTVAVSRTLYPTPAPLDWLGAADDLEQLLAESDFVVVTCPLTQQTEGMLNAARLAAMKSDAVLINVARGKIAVESDLFEALRDKTIAGAVLDVWYRYPAAQDAAPRPSEYPFHELDNVVMTPHLSAWTPQHLERRWDFVAANLDRYARGEALRNIVTLDGNEGA